MIYFRSILFYLGEALSTVPFFIVSIFALMFKPTTRSRMIAGWAKFVTWWLRITCGLTHEIDGMENIPDEPCIFACSHSSTWETITTQTFLPPLAWVLKKELLRIPVFGLGLKATGPIAIDRSDSKNALDQVIDQGIEKFKENRYVLIFPEGTRSPWGKPGNYKKGAAKLAIASGKVIVPVAHDAGRYWSKDSFWIKPGVIKCIFGPPITIQEKTDTEITREIREWILAQQLDQPQTI